MIKTLVLVESTLLTAVEITEHRRGREQDRGCYNNSGKKWLWLGPERSSGDAEKWLDSTNIVKLELRGFAAGMEVRSERRIKGDSKIFGLFNWKKSKFGRGNDEFSFGESNFWVQVIEMLNKQLGKWVWSSWERSWLDLSNVVIIKIWKVFKTLSPKEIIQKMSMERVEKMSKD